MRRLPCHSFAYADGWDCDHVDATLEVRAEIPEGASENVVRTVTENCRTLHFKDQGFEEK